MLGTIKIRDFNVIKRNCKDQILIADVGIEVQKTPKSNQSQLQQKQAKGRNPKRNKSRIRSASLISENPHEFPQYLSPAAKLDFKNKTLILCFSCLHFKWNLLGISGVYDFTGKKISHDEFVKSDMNLHSVKPIDSKAQVFTVDISKIHRHILMKRFTFELRYKFVGDSDVCTTTYIAEVPYFPKTTVMDVEFLEQHYPCQQIIKLYNENIKMSSGLVDSENRLLREFNRIRDNKEGSLSRSEVIKYALNIEDLSTQDELTPFALQNIVLKEVVDNNILVELVQETGRFIAEYLSFAVDKSKLPPDYENFMLSFMPMKLFVEGMLNCGESLVYSMISKCTKNEIIVQLKYERYPSKIPLLTTDEVYLVRFVPNRISYRASLNAFSTVNENGLDDFFDEFDFKPAKNVEIDEKVFESFDWYNKQIGSNKEQKLAIKNIINCTAFPFPYVVFGPPGTGKTSLIVEAVAQILKHKPKSRILITAQSNSACDEIGIRLQKHVSSLKIFRYYSSSLLDKKNDKTNGKLRSTSNLRNDKNQRPSMEELFHFKVVITTLLTSSRLIQLEVSGLNRHFDYIFVDECAAATEPEVLVPIAGFGTADKEITTNIVLLGDHKQLGPIISSDFAASLGLRFSLMERIMTKRFYSQDLQKSFNSKYVTQLLDNFRSHQAILQFCNDMFYDSKLRAKAADSVKSWAYNWSFLPNKTFPLLFHCVKTPSSIEKGGTSSFNHGEIKQVRFYVDSLLKFGVNGQSVDQKDIGIVSPYKAQHNLLKKNLNNFRDIEIGSAEYYQGREKKIIIISTVKSFNGVGFLKSEKRLNVCITRAKSLLIVIGNAQTLQQSSLWSNFLHYLKMNNACCGKPFTLKQPSTVGIATFDNSENNSDAEIEALNDRMERLKMLSLRI